MRETLEKKLQFNPDYYRITNISLPGDASKDKFGKSLQTNDAVQEEESKEDFFPVGYEAKRRSTIQPRIEFPVRDHQNSNELLAPVTEGDDGEMEDESISGRRLSGQVPFSDTNPDLLSAGAIKKKNGVTNATEAEVT